MKRFVFQSLCLAIFCVGSAFGQLNIPTKYTNKMPKELFTGKSGVIISTVSNNEVVKTETFNKLKTKIVNENLGLGIRIVNIVDGNTLDSHSALLSQGKKYDSLNVKNIVLIQAIKIEGLGAKESYMMYVTNYSGSPYLIEPDQKAFTLQAETFDKLIERLNESIDDKNVEYFSSNNDPFVSKKKLLEDANSEDQNVNLSENTLSATAKLINLSREDMMRGRMGSQHNFYFSAENENFERNAGFFGQKIRPYINSNTDAVNYLNKYRNTKWVYLATKLMFVGGVVAYSSEVARSDYMYFNDRQKVILGFTAASMITGAIATFNTNVYMQRAVENHNSAMLYKQKRKALSLVPDQVKLGARNISGPAPFMQLNWNLN